MKNFDYKEYSLENLENWIHDALSCTKATPEEIYNVIKKAVEENYYTYKNHTARCYELLCLLNGNGVGHIGKYDSTNRENDDCMPPWGHSDMEALKYSKKDKVIKWQLPVEIDGPSGEYYVNFPEDLLEAANLQEGDCIEWIDLNNGSYELRKVNGTK